MAEAAERLPARPALAEVPPLPTAEASSSASLSPSDDRFILMLKHLAGGAFAGLLAKSITAPLDRVKILLQIREPGFHGHRLLGALAAIYQKEGIRGLWRGNSATAMRVIPYAAIQVGGRAGSNLFHWGAGLSSLGRLRRR